MNLESYEKENWLRDFEKKAGAMTLGDLISFYESNEPLEAPFYGNVPDKWIMTRIFRKLDEQKETNDPTP